METACSTARLSVAAKVARDRSKPQSPALISYSTQLLAVLSNLLNAEFQASAHRATAMAQELCHTTLGISFEHALCCSLAALLGCGLWLWAWGRRLPPGPWRLAAAAPVVALNFVLPKLFCRWEESTTIVLMT